MKRLASAVLVLTVVLGSSLLGGQGVPTQGTAHAQGPITLGIDMDPYATTANSCSGDGVTDCTLGPIDKCVSVPATEGTTFEIDAYVDDLWFGHAGFNWDLDFPDTASGANLTMVNQIPDPLAGGNAAINLILQSAGSGPLTDPSEPVPDALTPHVQGMADVFGTNEMTPPYTQGTQVRYEFSVGASATPGLYYFSFVPLTVEVLNQHGLGYTMLGAGINVLDANSTSQYGVLALGVACPGPVPVGGIAELPDASGSPGRIYIALAALTTATLIALTAVAWYASRRWPRAAP